MFNSFLFFKKGDIVMSKIILPDGTEIAIEKIYTTAQGRISFYPSNASIDTSQFENVTSFTYEDEEGKKTKYSKVSFLHSQDIASEVTQSEGQAESTPSSILTLKITFVVEGSKRG